MQKYKFKVGDKVRIIDDGIKTSGSLAFVPEMSKYKGVVLTIAVCNEVRYGVFKYKIEEDNRRWGWAGDWLIPVCVKTLLEL